jgi:hypothetical protein
MSQDLEKYFYFQVGLLKNSFALDALWQDALKYHMVDQLGQLIALRLTEYYELMVRGALPPGAEGLFAAMSAASSKRSGREEPTTASSPGSNGASSLTGHLDASYPGDESIITASPDAEQNADEAAEYWTRL